MEILAMSASAVGREMTCGDKISATMALHCIFSKETSTHSQNGSIHFSPILTLSAEVPGKPGFLFP